MKCSRWETKIALYAGGDLDAAGARRVERHIDGCPSCRELVEKVSRDRKALAHLDARAFEDVNPGSVRGAVVAEIGARRPVGTRFRGVPRLAAGAVAMVALVVVGITLSLHERHEPRVAESAPEPALEVVAVSQDVPAVETNTAVPPPADVPAVETSAPRPEPFNRAARTEPPSVRQAVVSPSAPTEPLLMKILTDDPEIVIYWIVDPKGEEEHA